MEEGLLTAVRHEEHNPDEASDRLRICMECPLLVRETMVCNPSLWLDPKTGKTAYRAKPGYQKGCGCVIARKIHNPTSHCHLGKW